MPFRPQDIDTIRLYFEGFASALANFLRLYRGELPICWGGIDKERFGVLVYLTSQAMVVRVVPRLGHDPVRVRSNVDLDQVITSKWKHSHVATGNQVYASAVMKHLAGGPEVGMFAQEHSLKFWPKEQGGSCLIVELSGQAMACSGLLLLQIVSSRLTLSYWVAVPANAARNRRDNPHSLLTFPMNGVV